MKLIGSIDVPLGRRRKTHWSAWSELKVKGQADQSTREQHLMPLSHSILDTRDRSYELSATRYIIAGKWVHVPDVGDFE